MLTLNQEQVTLLQEALQEASVQVEPGVKQKIIAALAIFKRNDKRIIPLFCAGRIRELEI